MGSGYLEVPNGKLASSLFDEASTMQNSAIAKELFGEEFTEHFTQTRIWEHRQFSKSVTDWELKRYFEII